MSIRISLILAIITGIAVVVLNFVTVKTKVNNLQTDLAHTKSTLDTTRRDLGRTRSDLNNTRTELTQTKQKLDTTTAQLAAVAKEATAQKKRADQLTDELAKTKKERDNAQADLAAYKATGFTPKQILGLGKRLTQAQNDLVAVQEENVVLGHKIKQVQAELAVYVTPFKPILLPANLKGKILVSDPKWDFVVLNIGEKEGVLAHGQLLVNRGGRLVAKVIVTSVEKNRCIANVMPGWKLGPLMEGDQVIPAYPAS